MEKSDYEQGYIVEESQEITYGENPLISKFFKTFPALKHKNYQLYFTGQLISLTGTWLQMIAQAWLVFQLTHSAFLVGLISAIGSLPTLLFSLFGGVIVDRFPKRKILIITQLASMILALILGLLTVFNLINVYEIAIMAFLLGTVSSLDLPARQAFLIEMVGKNNLSSAIALNSGIFNGARVVGPGIAGIIISLVGSGGAFLLNSLSYIAAIAALMFIKVAEKINNEHPHPLKAIKEGIGYSFSNPSLRILLIFSGFASIFGWSYSTIMPVIVQDIFHRGAESLGYFYSASGLGALVGIVLVSWLSGKIKNTVFIVGGSILFIFSIFLFTFTENIEFAYIFLFFAGLGLLSMFAMINSTIQHNVKDNIRGRVMSIYTLMFMGMFPIGSFQIGFFAEHLGLQNALRLSCAIMFLLTLYVCMNRKKIEGKY